MGREGEELGIVKGVAVGLRDVGEPVLWFEVSTLHGGSLQVFDWHRAGELIKAADVSDVRQLEGRACVVIKEGMTVTFLRWHR